MNTTSLDTSWDNTMMIQEIDIERNSLLVFFLRDATL